jgi:hypothetical protein
MSYYQKTVALRQTNGDVPILFLRVIRVGYGSAECITQDCRGFAERDFMFADILRFLFLIPLKHHMSSVASLLSFANPAIVL